MNMTLIKVRLRNKTANLEYRITLKAQGDKVLDTQAWKKTSAHKIHKASNQNHLKPVRLPEKVQSLGSSIKRQFNRIYRTNHLSLA